MKRLTNSQIDHLKQRFQETLGKLAAQEVRALGVRPKPITYSDEEKLALIRKGKANLKPSGSSYSNNVTEFFTFPPTAIMLRQEAKIRRWDDLKKDIDASYAKKLVKLMDEVILGDASEALRLLQELEAQL